jgi:hypothetical protein
MQTHPILCHLERTRISYLTALTSATGVVLFKEDHMQLTEAATFDRKSGEGEGSAVLRTFRGNAQFYPQTELSSLQEIWGNVPGGNLVRRPVPQSLP